MWYTINVGIYVYSGVFSLVFHGEAKSIIHLTSIKLALKITLITYKFNATQQGLSINGYV